MMPTPPPFAAPAAEPLCRAALFEWLFLYGLQAGGPLTGALRGVGFDPERRQAHYPVRLLEPCLEVAALHVAPRLEGEAAHRELGRHFARGLGRTRLGRVVVLGLPRLGPVLLLERYPDYARALALPLEVRPLRVGERAFRVEHRGEPPALVALATGVLEEMVRATGVEPRVHLEAGTAGRVDALVSW